MKFNKQLSFLAKKFFAMTDCNGEIFLISSWLIQWTEAKKLINSIKIAKFFMYCFLTGLYFTLTNHCGQFGLYTNLNH